MKLDINLTNKLEYSGMDVSFVATNTNRCLQTRYVLYRILNLGVLKYEWGFGSAEPGAQPCCGWVREEVAPSLRGGPEV
jgi:hypothetical protein